MGNCVRRPTGGQEEMITSDPRFFVRPDQTSNSHTAVGECLSSIEEVALGDPSGAGGSSTTVGRSEYLSKRTEAMTHSKSQFSSEVEVEIEHSRVHWSEVTGLADLSEIKNEVELNRENSKLFQELMNDPRWSSSHPDPEMSSFFEDWSFLKLGGKIAEGGQAEIFEISDNDGNVSSDLSLKVFKRGSQLSQLRQQWPPGVLRKEVAQCVGHGVMLDNGRFGFSMLRCWGDLRKLIDQAMQERNNQGPPLPYEWEGKTLHAKPIMMWIAFWMRHLHENGIVHRNL